MRSIHPTRNQTKLTSGNASLNRACWVFQLWLCAAKPRLCAGDEFTEPVVISSESMKERRPVRLDECQYWDKTMSQRKGEMGRG